MIFKVKGQGHQVKFLGKGIRHTPSHLNFIFQPLEELFASKLQKAIKITEAPDPARGDDEVDGSSMALSVSCIIRERENTSILKFSEKK